MVRDILCTFHKRVIIQILVFRSIQKKSELVRTFRKKFDEFIRKYLDTQPLVNPLHSNTGNDNEVDGALRRQDSIG